MSDLQAQAPEVIRNHWAVRKHGAGNPVEIWTCAPGASAASIGADLVLDTDPMGGDLDVVVVEDVDGSIRPRNAAEQLEVARAAKLVELSAMRKSVLSGTFSFSGHRIQCNADSRQDFSELNDAIAMNIADALPQQWRTADNAYVEIRDSTVWGAFLNAYADHKKAAWTAFYAHDTALATHPDPANYDITTGWPA